MREFLDVLHKIGGAASCAGIEPKTLKYWIHNSKQKWKRQRGDSTFWMFHSLKPLESHATSNLYNNQKKLIMSTFNPHSLALAGFFQIVCLQELLLLPNFLISTTEPSSHFQHFFCSLTCLAGFLWIIVCHFLMWSLCLSIQVCISSSFLCFEHNHIAQTFIMP